ncbi:MAG: NAD(P)H nitroreductase [Deltaproteobacteria bacterium HGW-Deltaproteobacteria-22]|jgi:nitroreductase|nr:MAG: NAD(P)H nitroreductase [Deltaproteobacteria bacterium HGW-Deltaproteobacteria-22]
MTFSELTRERRSVRRFRPDPVPEDLVRKLVEAAGEAPSACNSQPWHFIALTDATLRARVAAACTSALVPINKFVPTAPMLVVQVGTIPNPASMLGGLVKNKRFVSLDNGIAAAHFCLAATELGLGTCILGWFDERKIKKLLQIPATCRVELVHAVGWPVEGIRKARRKPFSQIYSVDRFNQEAAEAPQCETLRGDSE